MQQRGHTVLTTVELRLRGARDHLHLAAAARLRRILLTHNERDFLLLHRAWRTWFDESPPSPRPQPPHLSDDRAAELVDEFIRGTVLGCGMTNRFFEWKPTTGRRERD